MPNLISKDDLRAVATAVEEFKAPTTFIGKTFFPNTEEFGTENIDYDLYASDRKVIGFVRRYQEGQFVDKIGIQTNSVTPPYLKPKMIVFPSDIRKRMAGESVYVEGSEELSKLVQEYLTKRVYNELETKIQRTILTMQAQAVIEGKVTAKDQGGVNTLYEIDFGRTSALQAAASNLWTAGNANPIIDVRGKASLINKLTGFRATDCLLGEDAADQWLSLNVVRQAISKDWASRGELTHKLGEDGAVWIGHVDGIDYWRLDDWYVDPATGVTTPIVGAKKAIVFSRNAPGTMYYGGIEHLEQMKGARYMKEWTQEDPAGQIIQVHSAPLPVTNHKDSIACFSVLS